jgi:D-sedoheptulose 7-phosphate isomerase
MNSKGPGLKDAEHYIRERLAESAAVKTELARVSAGIIRSAAEMAVQCLRSGGKILICGNGGSAADSQHIAAELVVRFGMNRKGLPAVALTTDTSILTAGANDLGFEDVFRRQIEALGRKGDLLIAISTSGRSPNVIRAAEQAKAQGMSVLGLTGAAEGAMDRVADLVLHVPSADTARIQESHMAVGHLICDLVEKEIFGNSSPNPE